MDAIRIGGLAISAALLAMVLRRIRPELGPAVGVAAGCITLLLLMPQLQSVMNSLSGLAAAGGIPDDYMLQLMKVGGVSLVMDFAAQTCRDAGEEGLALKTELAGRIMLIALSLPFMHALLSQIMSLSV